MQVRVQVRVQVWVQVQDRAGLQAQVVEQVGLVDWLGSQGKDCRRPRWVRGRSVGRWNRIDGCVYPRQPRFSERKDRLAEDSAVRDDRLARLRVPKPPTLIVCRIANEYTLGHVGKKGGVLVLLQVNVCKATERAHG